MKMSSSKRDLVAQQLRASVEKRAAVSARDRFGRDHALFETQFTSARGALESLRRARETFESKQLISTYQRVVTATKTQFPKINYKQLERVEELRDDRPSSHLRNMDVNMAAELSPTNSSSSGELSVSPEPPRETQAFLGKVVIDYFTFQHKHLKVTNIDDMTETLYVKLPEKTLMT